MRPTAFPGFPSQEAMRAQGEAEPHCLSPICRGFKLQSKQEAALACSPWACVLMCSHFPSPKGRVNRSRDKCIFVNCALNRLSANVTENMWLSLCFHKCLFHFLKRVSVLSLRKPSMFNSHGIEETVGEVKDQQTMCTGLMWHSENSQTLLIQRKTFHTGSSGGREMQGRRLAGASVKLQSESEGDNDLKCGDSRHREGWKNTLSQRWTKDTAVEKGLQ